MNTNPVVLDIETSGLDKVNCGIWQIGAIDLDDTKEVFFESSSIDDDDIVEDGALRVIGKTEEQLRDDKKQSQEELIEKFFKWMQKRKIRNLLCQNPQFDITFLEIRAKKYGLRKTIQHRAFDLHTISQMKHFNINNGFLLAKNNDSRMESDMGLTNTLQFCGIPETRVITGNEGVVKDGSPHNALDDCKLTGECYYRMVYGKNLFPEFSQFKIPNYLIGKGKK